MAYNLKDGSFTIGKIEEAPFYSLGAMQERISKITEGFHKLTGVDRLNAIKKYREETTMYNKLFKIENGENSRDYEYDTEYLSR